MKAAIVPIGNSRGVRIPKAILEQCHIDREATLEVVKGKIVISPIKKAPRAGWEEQFKSMHEQKDDTLLVSDRVDLDYGDWEW